MVDIEIHDLSSKELVKVLESYPRGRLEVKYGRVFWCSQYNEPVMPRDHEPLRIRPGEAYNGIPASETQRKKMPFDFSKAADALGSMM